MLKFPVLGQNSEMESVDIVSSKTLLSVLVQWAIDKPGVQKSAKTFYAVNEDLVYFSC